MFQRSCSGAGPEPTDSWWDAPFRLRVFIPPVFPRKEASWSSDGRKDGRMEKKDPIRRLSFLIAPREFTCMYMDWDWGDF